MHFHSYSIHTLILIKFLFDCNALTSLMVNVVKFFKLVLLSLLLSLSFNPMCTTKQNRLRSQFSGGLGGGDEGESNSATGFFCGASTLVLSACQAHSWYIFVQWCVSK